MNWNEPIFSKFFAGWCVIAPICGVLSWRPHIWVNGPSGSGKTWALDNILDPLVGRLALSVQSATTEAFIRQRLKSDALPVVFDEAESEDKRGQMRMQSILEARPSRVRRDRRRHRQRLSLRQSPRVSGQVLLRLRIHRRRRKPASRYVPHYRP